MCNEIRLGISMFDVFKYMFNVSDRYLHKLKCIICLNYVVMHSTTMKRMHIVCIILYLYFDKTHNCFYILDNFNDKAILIFNNICFIKYEIFEPQ